MIVLHQFWGAVVQIKEPLHLDIRILIRQWRAIAVCPILYPERKSGLMVDVSRSRTAAQFYPRRGSNIFSQAQPPDIIGDGELADVKTRRSVVLEPAN